MAGDARRFLIVEGNTPKLLARAATVGIEPAATTYARILHALDGDIETASITPSADGFSPDAVEIDAFDAVVFTGSGVSWSADDARAAAHRAMFERALDAEKPILGSCFGMQIAAVVFGGAVGASPIGREIGVARSLRLTPEGQAHPVFAGKPAVFDSVCIHRDEVTRLPDGATLLASNDHSLVQAFAQESFVGFQYHPELSLADIADYLAIPGRNILAAGDEFASQEDLDGAIAAFREIAADPVASKATRWRYGVTDHAADQILRTAELRNWLAMIRSTHDRDPNRRPLGRPGDARAVSGRL